MTDELEAKPKGGWWIFWPCFVAGLAGPLFGKFLSRWLPSHIAIGIAAFTAWFFIGVIMTRRNPPRYGIPRWLASILIAAGGVFSAGVLSYFFPLYP
jgi:hypothetical protein